MNNPGNNRIKGRPFTSKEKGILSKKILKGVLFFPAFLFLSGAFAANTSRDMGFYTEPALYYSFESGVSNTLSLQDITAYVFPGRLIVAAALRANLNEQQGLGLISLSVRNIPSPLIWMKFQVEVAHLEYPDILTGENQVAAMINFLPSGFLVLSAGMGYRSPDLADRRFHSPFDWDHDMNEVYPLFNLAWTFLHLDRFNAGFFTGNYYYLNLKTLDHIMLGVNGGYRIKDELFLKMQIITALKGVSGFVFSVNELQANAGLQISF